MPLAPCGVCRVYPDRPKAAGGSVCRRSHCRIRLCVGREEDIGISVRKAEKAMQTAKKKFYALSDLRRSARPAYLNSFLQQFLGGTFVPYLQPLYNLKTNRVYGAEVLVRQIDADGSIHTPVEFIDMMERQHLISLVDFQMLRKACVLMQKWKPQWPQLIIRRLIALCHDLHMRCIAEGIETDSRMQLLRTLGCDRLQGYKIGKPMPAEEFFARYAPSGAPAAENAAAKAPPHSSDP